MPDTTPAIENPRLYRLALQVDTDALRAVLWSTVEDSTMLTFSLPLDPTLSGHKALEEAIYAAPVLLSDFAGVDIVIRTQAYMIVPGGLGDEALHTQADYCRLTVSDDAPSPDDSILHRDTVPTLGLDVAWSLPADTDRFLARTFRNPRIHCHIAPLMRYFGRKSILGNSGKVYAHFNGQGASGAVDVIAFGADGTLACAFTHPTHSPTDSLYYIMAAMKYATLDAEADEVLLCGDASTRDTMMPMLRRYAAYVMPVIFPSAALRAGREAFNAPFPLIILPLCE